MQRYFGIKKQENQVILEPSDFYHIKTVMRMKENDKIEVVVDDKLYLCCLESVNPEIKIIVEKELPTKDEFMKHVVLVIPVLKEQKMDFILQKATELGVSEIIPVAMKRCMVKVDGKEGKKLDRWNKIMKEASEQSMRQVIPTLHPVKTLKEVAALEGTKIICSTQETTNTFKFFLQTNQNYDKLIIVVGPEGGIDPSEEEYLKEHEFVSVTLGSRIMRVETVPIYILSVLNYEYME